MVPARRALLHGVSLGLCFTFLLTGCGGPPADVIAIRLVDEFQAERVEGVPTEVISPEPLAVWNFSDPPEDPPAADAPERRGWKAGVGVSRLEIRSGRLSGGSTTDFPIIYIKRTKGLEEKDLVHSAEIRMRVSRGANLSISGGGPQKPDFQQILDMARAFPWLDRTPIVAAELQTYTIPLRLPTSSSMLHHLMIRPTDAAGADFEIESIRLISRKEHLARIPSGVGWQGLSDIYRESLVARSPEVIRLQVELPGQPWLDLQIGTIEYPPVTFKVTLLPDGSDRAQGRLLLERTVTTPHRWEAVPIDLRDYAGQQVSLAFSLQAEAPGTLGFWGSPVIRHRGGRSPAIRLRPQISLAQAPPQGVILIMADTLRRDHLNFHGYGRETAPQLSRTAAAGALFVNNIVQATWTKVSTPSILTSLYPTSHGVKDFSDRLSAAAVTLAEVYREAGYATVAYSSVLFTGKFTNLHQGFEELHEASSLPDRESSKTAREFVDRAAAWLAAHRDGPFFIFLHVFDPHDPYEPYQPYNSLWADPSRKEEHHQQLEKVRKVIEDPLMKQFGMPTRGELERAGIDPQDYVSYDIDWYDGSIRALDVEVGRLLERLRALGLLEKTLVVFTSDHGEEFHEHGRMFHGQSAYSELTHVPLVFYQPGTVPAGLVIRETIQSIDIMPTLLELSHLPKPEGLLGQSLLPLMATARDLNGDSNGEAAIAERAVKLGWKRRPAVSEKSLTQQAGGPPPHSVESFAIVLDRWKLIHNTKRTDGRPEFELFRRPEDPLDQSNVAAENPEVVERLLAELESWRKSATEARLPEGGVTEGLSKEELERLRSLGYIQ